MSQGLEIFSTRNATQEEPTCSFGMVSARSPGKSSSKEKLKENLQGRGLEPGRDIFFPICKQRRYSLEN